MVNLKNTAGVFLLPILLSQGGCADEKTDVGPEDRWNVVLLSIDTLRADHLGAYGYSLPTSPRLDTLANNGVTFETVVAQAPWTLPSHASLFSSEYPSVLNLGNFTNPNALGDTAECLAEVLYDSGYRTYAVSEAGFVSPRFGLGQGFEHFVERPVSTVDEAFAIGTAWIDGLQKREPFFLFVHTFDVHQYSPPTRVLQHFLDLSKKTRLLNRKDLPKILQSPKFKKEIAGFTAEDWACAVALYDASIRAVDASIADFLDSLEERGLLENTLIVITSDHGEEFGEHGGSGHGYNLHDENTQVPLILAHPDLPPARIKEQVRLLDVAPTVTSLLGIDSPPSWKGHDLTTLLDGKSFDAGALVENAHSDLKALRTADYKYVLALYAGLENNERLFDLESDPEESTNLVAKYPAVARQLRRELAKMVRENASDRRFHDTTAATIDTEKQEELSALGYTGGPEGMDASIQIWIDLLKKLESREGGK